MNESTHNRAATTGSGQAAAVGSGLLAAFYFVTNALPLLRNLDSVPASALAHPFALLILPQLIWTFFFLKPSPPAALITLLAGVAPQALYTWTLQWPTLSYMSLDSILFVLGDALPQIAYAWFLLGIYRGTSIRTPAYLLWIFTTFVALSRMFNVVMAPPPFGESPWLLIRPAILIFHPLSQSLFFRSQRRA